MDLKTKCDMYESALHWLARKENTYTQDKEKILSMSRAVLNVCGGYEYKINFKYRHIVKEFLEDNDLVARDLEKSMRHGSEEL